MRRRRGWGRGSTVGSALGCWAVVPLLGFALGCASAWWPSVSFGAESVAVDPNRVLLGMAIPELPDSVRQDFELSITRGLRFGGLEVVSDPASNGSATGAVSCGNVTCFRELGATRAAGLVARAHIDSVAARAREGSRRSYAIKIQVFSTQSGESLVERGTTCEACASDVAVHLGYLTAMDVGQRLSDLRRPVAGPVAAARPVSTVPAAPRPIASAPKAPPATVVASANASAFDPGASQDRGPALGHSRATKIGVGVLGGLGLAAVTTGTILWARGPQSTCSDLPASACGRTYNDAPTGWLLAGVGTAAIAGAIVWWLLPTPHATDGRSTAVAIGPGGLAWGGWF